MLPLLLTCLWIVAANVAGGMSSRRGHCALLVVTGIPILGLVTWQYGPVAGFAAFGVGASILRWPLRLGLARLRRRGRDAAEQVQPAE